MPTILDITLPVRNLLGVEPASLITRSQSIPNGQGVLAAGTLLLIDGTKATAAGSPHSVLAFDTDTGATGTTGVTGVTTYLGGSFQRATVEAASGFVPSVAMESYLRSMGIYLERSVGA